MGLRFLCYSNCGTEILITGSFQVLGEMARLKSLLLPRLSQHAAAPRARLVIGLVAARAGFLGGVPVSGAC
jgi:hypothetical protein